MIMSESFRTEVKLESKLGNREKAFKMLQEYRRECYSELERGQDKFFLDYCLCHHYMVDYKNTFMAKSYLNCIKDMFESGQESESEEDYYKYLWMNVSLNGKNMSKHQIVLDMTIVYKYFLYIGQINMSVGARETMFFYLKDEDAMYNCLDELVSHFNNDKDAIKSLLRECKSMSNNLYIEALRALQQHNVDIENVIFKVS